jgi:hypothetical protein
MTEYKKEPKKASVISDEELMNGLLIFIKFLPEDYSHLVEVLGDNNLIQTFIDMYQVRNRKRAGNIILSEEQKSKIINFVNRAISAYQRFMDEGYKFSYDKKDDKKTWEQQSDEYKSMKWTTSLAIDGMDFINKLLRFNIPEAPEAPSVSRKLSEMAEKDSKERNKRRLRAIIKLLIHYRGIDNFGFSDIAKELKRINTLIKQYIEEEKEEWWKKQTREYGTRRKERINARRSEEDEWNEEFENYREQRRERMRKLL